LREKGERKGREGVGLGKGENEMGKMGRGED